MRRPWTAPPRPLDALPEDELPEDQPDFASEHTRTSTTEAVSSGADAHSDHDIPRGLGGMDLKRRRLLD